MCDDQHYLLGIGIIEFLGTGSPFLGTIASS
jgi:hypothetical protein